MPMPHPFTVMTHCCSTVFQLLSVLLALHRSRSALGTPLTYTLKERKDLLIGRLREESKMSPRKLAGENSLCKGGAALTRWQRNMWVVWRERGLALDMII